MIEQLKGKLGDMTPATFYGGVRFLMEFLRTEYADKTVVFMSPARFYYEGLDGNTPSTDPRKINGGRPIFDYINIIKETAALYSIPVLDLYENLGIDPTIEEDRVKYTEDGLHFNDAGQPVIARCLGEFLKAI